MGYVRVTGYSLLGGAFLYGGWYYYQSQNSEKGLYVKNVKTKFELGRVLLTIEIYNATSIDVRINGLHADIFCKHYNIMDITTNEVVTVKNRQTTNIVVSVFPNWYSIGGMILDEGTNILEDLQNWNINNLDVMIKGNLFVSKSNVKVPFEKRLKND